MQVEQRPDGWHVLGDRGEHIGPIASLHELQDVMDNVEFHLQQASAKQAKSVASADGVAKNPLPKFNV